MDLLNQIIEKMTKQDVRHFKLFTSRLEYSYDRKDLDLFNYIRREGSEFSEEKAFKKFYQGKNINSYYRLKNRLLEHLNKSLIVQHIDREENIAALFLFLIYQFHASRQNFDVAKYYLSRAEIKAVEIEFVELLDIIYSEYIKLSNEILHINPETYIVKRKLNFEKLKVLREIDQMLASLSYRLKTGQNFSADKSVVKVLEQTIQEFSKDKEISASKIFRLKVATAASKILVQKHDYINLEKYLKVTFKVLVKQGVFNKSNHESKLQLLTYLVNALFKNKKYSESLAVAGQLHDCMKEFGGMLYEKYLLFYYNALVINYSVTDLDRAIELLEKLKKDRHGKKNSFYEFFIYLNLAIFYFEKKNYSQSIQHIVKMNLLDNFKKADESLRLKIGIAEMIIRYELKDYKIFSYRLKQVMNDFKELLMKKEFRRERDMIFFLKEVLKSNIQKSNKSVTPMLKKLIKQYQKSSDDNDIIKYVPWLQEKLNETNLLHVSLKNAR